jgi:hypothetical protein
VAAVGIGRIVGQAYPLEELQIAEQLTIAPALQTAEAVSVLGHGLPTPVPSISDFGLHLPADARQAGISDFSGDPRIQLNIRNSGTLWVFDIRN